MAGGTLAVACGVPGFDDHAASSYSVQQPAEPVPPGQTAIGRRRESQGAGWAWPPELTPTGSGG